MNTDINPCVKRSLIVTCTRLTAMGQSSLPEAPTVVIRLGREKVFFWMLYLKTRLVRLIWRMWIWAKESRNFCGYFCIGSIYYTTSGIKLGGGCVTLHHPLNPPVLSWNHHKTGRIIWPQNRLRWGKREWAHSLLDEVGVLRGQRYNPSENVPQASPPSRYEAPQSSLSRAGSVSVSEPFSGGNP